MPKQLYTVWNNKDRWFVVARSEQKAIDRVKNDYVIDDDDSCLNVNNLGMCARLAIETEFAVD